MLVNRKGILLRNNGTSYFLFPTSYFLLPTSYFPIFLFSYFLFVIRDTRFKLVDENFLQCNTRLFFSRFL